MDENKAIYGLVGYPVKHSLSPLMHNAAFAALGVGAVYTLFPLTAPEVEPFFKKLKSADNPIFGLNVTVPYKEKVVPLLDSLSPFAKKVGAVNTVVISPKRALAGQNTDGPGFLAHLNELGFSLAGKRVSIIGAGGAARSLVAVLSLVPERPTEIRLFDVEQEKAHRLAEDLGERLDVSLVSVVQRMDDLKIKDCDLLINATPVGMKPNDPALVKTEDLQPGMLVYDLIYNPAETALLQAAKSRGAKVANGLGMLFYQGVLAFQHWGDIELAPAIKAIMRKSLEAGLHYE